MTYLVTVPGSSAVSRQFYCWMPFDVLIAVDNLVAELLYASNLYVIVAQHLFNCNNNTESAFHIIMAQ